MPPRLLSVVIVLFWLATTGWLVSRDLWPHLQPGEPPPFAIDLVDEAQRHAVPISWTVSRGGKAIGRADTRVIYRESDDTFALRSDIKNLTLEVGLLATVKVERLTTVYRVSRAGELREMSGDVQAAVLLGAPLPLSSARVKGELQGNVQDRHFVSHGWIEVSAGSREDFTPEPVEVSSQGLVLNPLHPVNRLVGLRPGQRWRMPMMNPLSEALGRSAGGLFPSGPRFLDAEVLPEPQRLAWGRHDVPCLVIEYRDDQREVSARTWVKQSDGLVLRQEALQGGEVLVLQRD
jgi:hypothetical protein